MKFVERNGYYVVVWPQDRDLGINELWSSFPELVVDRFLVNTSFDSGSLMVSESQQAAGWRMIGRLAHSPRIRKIEEIPHDQFDEWLIFEQPVEVPAFQTMVNRCYWSPLEFDSDSFWQEVCALQPLHVLGENYGTYLASRDKDLLARIMKSESGHQKD